MFRVVTLSATPQRYAQQDLGADASVEGLGQFVHKKPEASKQTPRRRGLMFCNLKRMLAVFVVGKILQYCYFVVP